MLKNSFILILATLFIFSCNQKKTPADLIIHHAKIYSVDSSFTVCEAMAIVDGKIADIGSNDFILEKYSSANSQDLNSSVIYPGFIDAHCHFTGYATDMWKCNLIGTKSFEEVLEKLKVYAQQAPMEWIYGRGWDQNDWTVKEFPNKEELDKLFPDRPVFLKRIDGHAALVNQFALDKMGIHPDTKVEGGSVEIKHGKLTGILIDNAMDLVDLKIPKIDDSLAKKYFLKAQEDCFALGLTGVHDCGVSEHTVEMLDEVQKNGLLKMKVYALLSDDSTYYEKWLRKGIYKTNYLTVGGFKLYGDGALGSRGACLLHPYHDKENWHGFLLSSADHFNWVAQQLINSPFQLCTHAIGDSANRQLLNTYANVLKGKNNRRWRIEHAQVVDENDFHFFGDYDIIPSVQPTHATSDMYWAEDRLGKQRVKNAYAYKKFLNQYGKLALGTDFPVEDLSPFKTFYAAVVRKDSNAYPENGFQSENAITREQALRGMTVWAAFAAFEEKEKGSLEKNKAADFIILNRDLMTCKENELISTQVIATYVNGDCVYSLNH